MPDVTIFAPSPLLTVTLEGDPSGTDLHLHAGGQGVWQSRMLRTFGCAVTICAVLTGESGRVVRHLLGTRVSPCAPSSARAGEPPMCTTAAAVNAPPWPS
jgi:hypothetical protein